MKNSSERLGFEVLTQAGDVTVSIETVGVPGPEREGGAEIETAEMVGADFQKPPATESYFDTPLDDALLVGPAEEKGSAELIEPVEPVTADPPPPRRAVTKAAAYEARAGGKS